MKIKVLCVSWKKSKQWKKELKTGIWPAIQWIAFFYMQFIQIKQHIRGHNTVVVPSGKWFCLSWSHNTLSIWDINYIYADAWLRYSWLFVCLLFFFHLFVVLSSQLFRKSKHSLYFIIEPALHPIERSTAQHICIYKINLTSRLVFLFSSHFEPTISDLAIEREVSWPIAGSIAKRMRYKIMCFITHWCQKKNDVLWIWIAIIILSKF